MSTNKNNLSNFKTPPSSPRGLNLADPGTELNQVQQITNQSAKKMKQKRNANSEYGTIHINPQFRKALIHRNGKEELHFQTLRENGMWGPATHNARPLLEYSNKSNTRVKKSPTTIQISNNDAPVMRVNASKAHGGKRSIKKKTHTKKRVCFSKKGKKTRCVRRSSI